MCEHICQARVKVKSIRSVCHLSILVVERLNNKSHMGNSFDDHNYIDTEPRTDDQMSRHNLQIKNCCCIICSRRSSLKIIILDRRRFLKENMTESPSSGAKANSNSDEKNKIFLDFMLTQSDFTDEEIENEVETFLFAGQDTIVATLSFCLFELSQHPDIQDRCFSEIIDVVGENLENASMQDFKNLKYVENVINETMRLYTPVPLIARKVDEDVLLPSGYTIPAGSAVNLNLLALHRSKKNFPKPEEFLPERFDDKNKYSQGFTFIPFSAGPRNCLGQKFAMLEIKVVLSVLLRHYKLLPSEHVKELTLETGIVLHSLENFPVRITART